MERESKISIYPNCKRVARITTLNPRISGSMPLSNQNCTRSSLNRCCGAKAKQARQTKASPKWLTTPKLVRAIKDRRCPTSKSPSQTKTQTCIDPTILMTKILRRRVGSWRRAWTAQRTAKCTQGVSAETATSSLALWSEPLSADTLGSSLTTQRDSVASAISKGTH